MASPKIEELRVQIRGQAITEADAGYDDARKVYNAIHDRRPALVVRCANAGDVMAAVNYARDQGGDLSVRGGSHSAPGFGTNDGGVVIDLSPMRGIRVDPRAQTARADGGCTWGDFNHATHAFGGPLPTGLERRPAHGATADVHQIDLAVFELTCFVGRAHALHFCVRHGYLLCF